VISIVLSGKPGVRYHLQDSADLTTWTTIATNTLPASGRLLLPTRCVSAARHFFRAQVAP
jgi:hypothetical protein